MKFCIDLNSKGGKTCGRGVQDERDSVVRHRIWVVLGPITNVKPVGVRYGEGRYICYQKSGLSKTAFVSRALKGATRAGRMNWSSGPHTVDNCPLELHQTPLARCKGF